MRDIARILVLAVSPFTGALSAFAAAPPCAPCAGVVVGDPFAPLPEQAGGPKLAPEARLYVAFELALDGSATPAAAHALASSGATPWLRLVFRTPPPLAQNIDGLRAELDAAAALARSRPARAHYQILWRPEEAAEARKATEETAMSAREYAFLLKNASVAIGGEDPDATVVSAPLPTNAAWLDELYGEEVAAYLDAIALPAAGGGLDAATVKKIGELDLGKPLVLDGVALPAEPLALLSLAADAAERGFAIVLFDARDAEPGGTLSTTGWQALTLLANEFRGDLSFDATTRPTGAHRAWSFVRGSDLALRVIVEPEAGADRLTLRFPDPQLRTPALVVVETGEVVPLGGSRRSVDAVEVRVADPGAAVVLRLERASIAELEGVAEEVTVASERQIPVEEILRRLQAFEEAQNRRLVHWQALNATTLRFQAASGVQAVEATFEGEVFFRPGQPFDWAWQSFYLNGVRWKGKSIPEIPLIQPEKAAAMPLEILFTKEYRYALKGAERIGERDCWAVEFEPNTPVEGRALFRGTVWVDRASWARVRTRAVQLGLTGEVLSNEETIDYSPVDAAGATAPWGTEAFVLPLRTVGQQILSVLNVATVVEKEVLLTAVLVNGEEFDSRRETAFASEATMVRDTASGLRYLVKEGAEPGERVVKEGYDSNKLFLLGGVLYDESLDFPLPLAGLNYFDLNFRGKKGQLNAFFGGVLGILNYADPDFLGTKIDLGVDLFGIAIASSDQLYRGGVEVPSEEVEVLPGTVRVNLGFPLGNFVKVSSAYRLSYAKFGDTDNTAPEFVLPSDTLTHRAELGVQYARSGYRLNLQAAFSHRSTWEFWGLPGNSAFDPDHQEYATWGASVAKNWYLPGFRKFGLSVDYLDGSHLDRFSKYQFGFFGDARVHGYQIGKVRAESGYAAHATYGLEIGKVVRLDAVGDAAWATDEESGLDHELLAGVGLIGSFMGPWETVVQVDIGTAVAGPDDGVVAYIVFLKLFD